jgi:hypothetical protein
MCNDSADEKTLDPPPQTAPETIPFSMRGFQDAVHAERFAQLLAILIRGISRYINLERLDGVTVAFDYDEALAELDRGFTPGRPLTRTSDDLILGVAMAPAVLRDGMPGDVGGEEALEARGIGIGQPGEPGPGHPPAETVRVLATLRRSCARARPVLVWPTEGAAGRAEGRAAPRSRSPP